MGDVQKGRGEGWGDMAVRRQMGRYWVRERQRDSTNERERGRET